MNVIVTSITADQASRKWTPTGKSQVLIQTAEVRGRNSGRNNILIYYYMTCAALSTILLINHMKNKSCMRDIHIE